MELGDHSTIRCEKTGFVADIEFKTKGFIGGKYDMIHGTIKNESTGEKLYEIEGKWNEKMTIKNLKTKKTETFFDATSNKETPITTKSLSAMSERESRKLWKETTDAIKARDQQTATNAKSVIEDGQREEAKAREERGEAWKPKFFDEIGPEDYRFKAPAGLSGKALKDRMEELAGGITSERTPTAATASSVTASGPPAQPAQPAQHRTANFSTSSAANSAPAPAPAPAHAYPPAMDTPTKSTLVPTQTPPSASAGLRQQQYNYNPTAPGPALYSGGDVNQSRPQLHPVDSEDQPFVDAQEQFDRMSLHGR